MAKERSELEELELTDEEQKMLSESDFPADEPAPTEDITPEPPPPPQAPEPPPAPEPPQPTPQVVPLAALQEQRRENRELKQRLQAVEELKQQIMQMREQARPKEVVPTFQEDPFAAIEHRFNVLEQRQQQRDQIAQQIIQQNNQENAAKKFSEYIVNDEMNFRQNVPDFEEAFNTVIGKRVREIQAMGVYDPEEISNKLREDAIFVTAQAMKAGKSPSQAIYEIAIANGFTPKQAQQQAQQVQQQQGMQNPPQPQDRPRDQQGRFAPVQQGIQANKTLQPGGANSKNPDVEALLNASDEDFRKMWGEFWGDEAKNTIL